MVVEGEALEEELEEVVGDVVAVVEAAVVVEGVEVLDIVGLTELLTDVVAI